MIKAVIVDDELHNITNLEKLLSIINQQIKIVGKAQSIEEAEKVIAQSKPDVIFLDIELPDGTGFELLERANGLQYECIFVTAYDQYALQAIKKKAFDYLLKPIDIEELFNCTKLLEKRLETRKQENVSTNELGLLPLPTINGFELFQIETIKYILSKGNYCEFHFKSDKKIIASKNIGEFEKILPTSQFIRIHNEHIINITEISQYFKGRGGYVVMKDDKTLAVSSRNKSMFLENFLKK